ncbi:MAG: hypothetical protein IJJ43_03030 [Oscillospiraceae bacterium]|nr:hypothetical protein [Oscillospiraceae bacterium]
MRKKTIRFPALLLLPLAAALALFALPRLFPRSVAAPAHALRATESGELGYYIDGVLQTDYTGIVQDSENERWYYAVGGLVDRTYTGFAANAHGWWYVENGAVDFSRCALVRGVVDGEEDDWYVLGGQAKTDYSGLSVLPSGEQYVIRDGRLDHGYTGFLRNADGWWYAEEGRVSDDAEGLIEGSVNGTDGLWYVSGGKVQLDYRGLLALPEAIWCVNGGRAETEKTGIFFSGEEAWLCRGGQVDAAARCAWSEDETGDWIVIAGRAQPVRSEEEQTLFRAMRMLEGLVTEGMSPYEQLQVCFEAVKSSRECSPRYPHVCDMTWPVVYANDIFVDGAGNCFSFAAAFAYLAKAIGYEEVYACNSGGHGWAEIDGLIFDPEWSRHRPNYNLFGLSYDTALGASYRKAMIPSSAAGKEWMRVKI